jgi:putative ABC transport system permease protein
LPNEDSFATKQTAGDRDFVRTMGIELKEIWSDTISNYILINECMSSKMKEAYGDNWKKALDPFIPAGIIKDFHITSLHSKLEPFFLNVLTDEDRAFRFMLVSFEDRNVEETIGAIRNVWSSHHPDKLFDYLFVDDVLAQQYKVEKQSIQIINIILVVILIIIGMGLLGTVTIMMKNRQKEIGIRKVLGASENSLLISQIRRVSIIILVAIGIASPVTLVLGNRWLMNFQYKTEMEVWPFVLASAIVLLFSWSIVIWKVRGAVKVNPVECLKYE